MPRPKKTIPPLYHHKACGQAFVRLNGRDHYLGLWGTSEAQRRYGKLVAELAAGGLPDCQRQWNDAVKECLSVNELILAFLNHAQSYYVDQHGHQTDEVHCFRSACRPLKQLFGESPVDEFGPLALRANYSLGGN